MYSCLRGDVQTLRGQGGGEVGQIQDTCTIMTHHQNFDVIAVAAYLTEFSRLIGVLSLTGLNVAPLKHISTMIWSKGGIVEGSWIVGPFMIDKKSTTIQFHSILRRTKISGKQSGRAYLYERRREPRT